MTTLQKGCCSKCLRIRQVFAYCGNESCPCHANSLNTKTEYEHISHSHCWAQGKDPACGQKIENHKQCCLCDLPVPTKTGDWETQFRKQYDELGLKAPKNSMPGAERELIIWYFRNLLRETHQQLLNEVIEATCKNCSDVLKSKYVELTDR